MSIQYRVAARGGVLITLVSINAAALQRAQLLLEWVTVC